jgi:hypothetical protein
MTIILTTTRTILLIMTIISNIVKTTIPIQNACTKTQTKLVQQLSPNLTN